MAPVSADGGSRITSATTSRIVEYGKNELPSPGQVSLDPIRQTQKVRNRQPVDGDERLEPCIPERRPAPGVPPTMSAPIASPPIKALSVVATARLVAPNTCPSRRDQMTSKISPKSCAGGKKQEGRAHRSLCYLEKRINPTRSVAPIPTPSAINLSKVSRCSAAAW